MKIVLASQSPRRKQLLEQIGLDFDIIVSDIEETIDKNLTPEEVAKSLAYQKAKNVAEKIINKSLVIGSDTIVVRDNIILGKPQNEDDAFNMLKSISGKIHKVITGVCIINTEDNTHYEECDVSSVKMREITDEEIKAYIKSKEPLDKAGSYAIQGLGTIFVEKMEGSFSGIVGLPLFIVDKLLKKFGVKIL